MKYSTLIRSSAVYDLLLTAPFALPGVAEGSVALLSTLNVALGGVVLPPLAPIGMLFAHLAGSLVTVWSVLRLVRPRWEFGVADASARALFSGHFALVIALGGYPLGWFLLVPEALWGLAQAVGAALYLKHELPTDSPPHS